MNENCLLATVGSVHEDGLTLIFAGNDAPSEKHYKCNTGITFHAGDRVKVCECSGSYIVEYIVGNPSSGGGGERELPEGGAANSVLAKDSAEDYDVKWLTQQNMRTGAALSVANYYGSTQTTSNYDIQFKTDRTYSPTKLYWRMGTSGTWHELT